MKKIASSIKLSPDQVGRLNELAADLGAHARTGPTSGEPSWRVLVAAIADGEVTLSRVHPVRILK
jgi:hypothetical protein